MAISANTVLECRQGGSDTNGGGFVTGASGTDWSLQDSAQYSVTDGVTNATTTITSATAAFGTDVVGNLVYVQGGTGAVVAAWYQIISRTSATAIVVDRTNGLTAGTGVTLHIGGAFATPGQMAAVIAVSGMKGWLKYNATPYSLTTATVGAAGPAKIGVANLNASIEGYEATRGDRTANRPVVQWNTAPGSLTYAFVHNAGGTVLQEFINIKVDGNSQANAGGFDVGNLRCGAVDCVAINCNQAGAIGFLTTGNAGLVRCFATACTTGFSGAGQAAYCVADSCTLGFSNLTALFKCLMTACVQGCAASSALWACCTADSCTTAGYNMSNDNTAVNCLATNCSGGSAKGFTVTAQSKLLNCAVYNNTTHVSGTPWANVGLITLSADPYANQAGGDFSPNNTAGGGAAVRADGIGCYGQTTNEDIGAVQHADPAAGGATVFTGEF